MFVLPYFHDDDGGRGSNGDRGVGVGGDGVGVSNGGEFISLIYSLLSACV